MRTRSTCLALSLAAICTLSLATAGCSPDAALPLDAASDALRAVGDSPSALVEQTAWMGKYHNDALDFALKRIKASPKASKFERCKVGVAALKEFQKAYAKTRRSAVFLDLTLSDGECEKAAARQSDNAPTNSVNIGIPGPRADMSIAATSFMDQIVTQVDYTTSALALSFAVNRIVNQASYTVDPLEATAVAGAGSITTSSASYWEANEGAWREQDKIIYDQLSNGIEPIPVVPANMSGRTKAIIRADALAGVSTLLSQWFMGEAALAAACIRAAAASLAAGIFAT
jgi:hypothetical protein